MIETWFDKIHNMSQTELANFLNEVGRLEGPWATWFDENYCSKCEPIEVCDEECNKKRLAAKCELEPTPVGVCEFYGKDFSNLIEAWLSSQASS